jgi:aprataxin
MSNPLLILRQYALKSSPATSLPSSVLYGCTDDTLTIFDYYPKAIFHFLILPRPRASLNVHALSNLRSLLRLDKKLAKACLLQLQDAAQVLRTEIEAEMVNRYGFKWDIWVGFHALPSME